MVTFIQQSGPFILIQGFLALVVLALALANLMRLLGRRGPEAMRLRTSIDGVVFWGCLTAILGFLGQWAGLHKAANAIHDMGITNPRLVVLGFGESLGTSVFGMFVLVGALFLWSGLRALQSSKAAH
jgi:hypothetical protein